MKRSPQLDTMTFYTLLHLMESLLGVRLFETAENLGSNEKKNHVYITICTNLVPEFL